MKCINYECKILTDDLAKSEKKLQSLQPRFVGEDYQVDTYFNVAEGRLKLRHGNIENALIYYHRNDARSITRSDIILYRHQADPSLLNIMKEALGIQVVVAKKRKIYFVDNVKFHFDEVDKLGAFVEIEAIDETGERTIDELKAQCDHYFEFFEFRETEIVGKSYSDLLEKESDDT